MYPIAIVLIACCLCSIISVSNGISCKTPEDGKTNVCAIVHSMLTCSVCLVSSWLLFLYANPANNA